MSIQPASQLGSHLILLFFLLSFSQLVVVVIMALPELSSWNRLDGWFNDFLSTFFRKKVHIYVCGIS